MNKAFMREPDSDDMACPRCGARGEAVARETIESLAKPDVIERLAPTANCCLTPTCEVAYFDAFERAITTDELRRDVYPKNPDAPICPCFAITVDEIDQDLAEGTVHRTRRLVEQAKSPDARCEFMSYTGRSCANDVQRYYMRGKS